MPGDSSDDDSEGNLDAISEDTSEDTPEIDVTVQQNEVKKTKEKKLQPGSSPLIVQDRRVEKDFAT